MTHYDSYWPTSDEWYPNFPRNTVRVRVSTLRDNTVRISVWGADDCGMERDYYPHTEVDDLVKFAKSFPNPLTKEWLRSQGFKPA